MARNRRKGFRWSRQNRDRPRRLKKHKTGSDYTYDANDAGEPMLSWAQAQQTVKLVRGQSFDRFTIATELALKPTHLPHGTPKEKVPRVSKKTSAAMPASKDSFEPVEPFQKQVDHVLAPPDAQQESYVCDEEDHEMLKLVNKKQRFNKFGQISRETFEEVITQLEQESIKNRGVNTSFNLPVDEDAVCSVCQKGDCDNTNMILFCDVCNLAVHQECYGVPYIPEGQWHCRRCTLGSGSAQCLLCPNSDGALKQTEDGHWAHVICAMYMPRVAFKSLQLLEPIMNIDKIEKSRWKLKCVVCKAQPGYKKEDHVGACIQCEEPSCKTAFHVTCAQKAGYSMELKPVKEDGEDTDERDPSAQPGVKALAYCEKHSRQQPEKKEQKTSGKSARNMEGSKAQQQSRMDSLKIDPEKLLHIANSVKLQDKPVLFNLIICYWKSKRRHRNGLPLLKRPKGRCAGVQRPINHEELEESRTQVKLAMRTAEKLRTLIELKLRQQKNFFRKDKLNDVRQCFAVMPLKSVLLHLLGRLKALDKEGFFANPVTEKIAPQYFSIIKHPMDFSKVTEKLDNGKYVDAESFEKDLHLIIDNCLKYNTPDTVFHQAALRFRDAALPMMETAKHDYENYLDHIKVNERDLLTSPDPGPVATEADLGRDVEEDLLSEISSPPEEESNPTGVLGKDTNVRKDGAREALPSSSLDIESPINNGLSSSASSHSPTNSRLIPCSPRSRKTPLPVDIVEDNHHEDDLGSPSRKRARITPAESEDAIVNGSQVPAPFVFPTATLPSTMMNYRSGRLNAMASESELDLPFPSEDSTDLASSDYDLDSDGPARHLRRKRPHRNIYTREYFEIRPRDFVWAKVMGHASFPAIVVSPLAKAGYCLGDGTEFVKSPPREILNERENLEKKSGKEDLFLVNFFDTKRKWVWITRDKMDLMHVDRNKDQLKLNESKKVAEKRNVKKAYDLALKYLELASPSTSYVRTEAPIRRGTPMDTDASGMDDV
ncbi:bromodomain-containing protein 1-like [Paramacrobiotus metropolitanus]|uniref:bromodomain-containing protein 1-like n=1 Tax=Paramacrobiotus metropolitanus TaxID=2943436 RepID=UPI0024457CBA|nr:bromodomain-containing protein 1-like [Paramacrobiotus metropolitanus]